MNTRNPSHHQTCKGWRLKAIVPWIFALKGNSFLTEAKTVSAGTVFNIRDTAQLQEGERGRKGGREGGKKDGTILNNLAMLLTADGWG